MVKRIRPAKHYQRADNAVRKIILKGRRPIARDLRSALGHLSSLVPNSMVRLIKDGRLRELKDKVDFKHYREVLKKPFQRIADVYQEGAQLGVRKINGAFHQKRRRVRFRKEWSFPTAGEFLSKAVDTFNFDMFNEDTLAALRQAQDDLIQQLETDARDTIEQIVQYGAYEGLSAEEIVSDIRDMISLTDFQATAVMNYRSMLETLDPTALQRQLRNTTMDAAVQDAIDSGQLLSGDIIDSMVDDYTSNYLDYRASTIAQTESVRAANEGLHDAYSQAIDRGALPADAVVREWELGDSPCPICESIPDNNPDGVGVDETFDSDDGPVDDPPVHPNACFAGTLFKSYGELKQIVRAQYKGPAITLKTVLFDKNSSQSAPRYAAIARAVTQSAANEAEMHSDGDLLISDFTRTTVPVSPRIIDITIGPNHPMLTRRGFVAARKLQEGDELLYDLRAVPFSSLGGEIDFKQMHLFEDAFATLADTFKTISPTGPRTYFHGDEVFTYGKVDVVFPKRGLLPIWDSGGIEHLCECPLMGAYTDAAHVASCRTCQQRFSFVFRSASGQLSGTNNRFPLGFSEPLPPFFHSARIISCHWTTFEGFAFDASTSNAIYNAGGFIVKNCMCSVNYVTDISQVPEDDTESGGYDTNAPMEGVG